MNRLICFFKLFLNHAEFLEFSNELLFNLLNSNMKGFIKVLEQSESLELKTILKLEGHKSRPAQPLPEDLRQNRGGFIF